MKNKKGKQNNKIFVNLFRRFACHPCEDMNIKVVYEINEQWSEYNKVVAMCQMTNYGKIYLDEYNEPIDDEYLLEELYGKEI